MRISDWSSDVCSSDLLVISSLTVADGAPKRWREVAPFLWHEVGGNDRLAAQLVDGKPVRFANDEYAPLVVWERQPWWRSTAVLTPLSQIAFAILLLTLVTIPVQAAVRWRDSPLARSAEHTSELPSLMRTSSAVFCLKKKTTTHTNCVTQAYITNTY